MARQQLQMLAQIGLPVLVVGLVVSPPSGASRSAGPHQHLPNATDGVPSFPATLGTLHHRISTDSAPGQHLFDRALTMYYGFNRDAAQRTFARAATLDPRAAMPQVGIALARGPNLNMDATPSDVRAACDASRDAVRLAADSGERRYADAVVARYCTVDGQVNARAYADKMRGLAHTLDGDLDASVLYADSLLQIRPRTPEQDDEIVSVLESTLHRDAMHVGANHLYIHAVEGSTTPMRALESARRLETLVPGIGHLLHMPSHVYMRVGDYDASIRMNARAVSADFWYLQHNPPGDDGAMYYIHDLESLAVADAFDGRFAEAQSAAREFARVEAGLAGDLTPQRFSAPLAVVLMRFHAWTEVLALGAPSRDDPFALMLSSFARAQASLALDQSARARQERDAFDAAAAYMPATATFRGNPIERVVAVFRAVLAARFIQAERGLTASVESWRQAVAAEELLDYHEPPPFYYPTRESLGAALFAARQFDQAERVFRADLARNPGNGRSLFGLWQALLAMRRTVDAERAHAMFRRAWRHADAQLSIADL